MATYKVNPDGKAPAGLSVGDLVVTGGGTYLITGFKSGGGYHSKLVDRETTTYNYRGSYAQPPHSYNNSSGNNYSGNQATTNQSTNQLTGNNIAGTMSELTNQYLQALNNMNQSSYQPSQLPQIQTLSFDDAVAMAEQVMAPQYQSAYQQAAVNASQRLDQAGLYNTVYGQALAAEAERDVARDLNAAIMSVALQLTDASEEQAKNMLELAVKERQFGANYNANQKSEALKYVAQLIS